MEPAWNVCVYNRIFRQNQIILYIKERTIRSHTQQHINACLLILLKGTTEEKKHTHITYAYMHPLLTQQTNAKRWDIDATMCLHLPTPFTAMPPCRRRRRHYSRCIVWYDKKEQNQQLLLLYKIWMVHSEMRLHIQMHVRPIEHPSTIMTIIIILSLYLYSKRKSWLCIQIAAECLLDALCVSERSFVLFFVHAKWEFTPTYPYEFCFLFLFLLCIPHPPNVA